MSETRQVLTALLEHPGWAVFAAHVAEEWAPAGCWRKVKALEAQSADLPTALKQIDYTNQEVGKLMRWVSEEVQRLSAQERVAEPSLVRGGYRP